jgi:hypothetical protein
LVFTGPFYLPVLHDSLFRPSHIIFRRFAIACFDRAVYLSAFPDSLLSTEPHYLSEFHDNLFFAQTPFCSNFSNTIFSGGEAEDEV